jgi:hypothetical protein
MPQVNMTFKIGETVRYSHAFLKSVGGDRDMAVLNGVVQSVKEYPQLKKTVVKVLWAGDDEIRSSLAQNLAHVNYDITE